MLVHYGCPSTQQKKAGRECQNSKGRRAEELEARVWDFVSSLLKDPARLKAGLEEMIAAESADMRGDPEQETKLWLEKLSEVEQERRGYLRLAAKGHRSDEVLDETLAELKDTRETAERALGTLQSRQKVLEELERDKDALLKSYAQMTSVALDDLAAEERQRIYKMMRLHLYTHADGDTELSGVFSLRDGFYIENITSPREGAPARRGLGRSGICAMATPTRSSPRTGAWRLTPPGTIT